MRRARKTRIQARRNRLSVSLFPFLAVLICTLGVLIMMLVMAVKAADDQVRQTQTQSDAAQQAEIEELESVRDLRLAQIEGLELVRPDALDRLSDSRANRSHIEEEIRRIKREFRRVGEELLELEGERKRIARLKDPAAPVLPEVPLIQPVPQPDPTESQRVLQALEEKITQAKEQLETKRTTVVQEGPSKFVIVPHKGGGGTFRRPIFMECTNDAITLQPSGIRLAKSEFAPPLQPGNMLDSALLTIREYWRRYDLAGQEGAPYPLIVVRPGGADTFVLARLAMKSWDDEFGYELVEASTNLDFGTKDEQLETEVQEAIREARARQELRLARSRHLQSNSGQSGSGSLGRLAGRRGRGSKRNLRPGLVAAGPQGGFVSNAAQFSDDGAGLGYSDQPTDSYVSAASGISGEHEGESDEHSEFEQTQSSSFESQLSQSSSPTYDEANSSDSNSSTDSNQASNSPNQPAGEAGGQNPGGRQSLASERGADWALPTLTPGATGYVRPIRVVCSQYALEVFNGTDSKKILMTGDTADSIDALVDEIWAQIDQWGIPGANAYWKPQLKFRILDGGQQRYLELKSLLYKSGLTLTSANPTTEQR